MAKFHNSIILLGEFYNRLKLNNNNPVLILGQSLLELLGKELILILDKKEPLISEFGKVILTQITQNGSLFKVHHEKQFNAVLDLIRRCLIEIRQCSDKTRAFLSFDVFRRFIFQFQQIRISNRTKCLRELFSERGRYRVSRGRQISSSR